MKKSQLSYRGILFLLAIVIMLPSCAKKYGCLYLNFSGGIDHEALYHPNVTVQTSTVNPFGKVNQESKSHKSHLSIPPNH